MPTSVAQIYSPFNEPSKPISKDFMPLHEFFKHRNEMVGPPKPPPSPEVLAAAKARSEVAMTQARYAELMADTF